MHTKVRYYLKFLSSIFLFLAIYRIVLLLALRVDAPWLHQVTSLWAALRLDASVAAYLISPIIVADFIFSFFKRSTPPRIAMAYSLLVGGAIGLIILGNLALYPHWRELISYRALVYLQDWPQATASLTWLQLLGASAIVVTFFWLIYKVLRKWYRVPKAYLRWQYYLLMVPILFLMARGGWQLIPINSSASYYSHQSTLNDVAANPVWHLAYSLKTVSTSGFQPYEYLPLPEARDRFIQLMQTPVSPMQPWSAVAKPNVILVMLESFTADVFSELGGDSNTLPFLNQWIKDQLLFTQCYASGTRTDQGIVSIQSGWPATPNYSIMRFGEKHKALPAISKSLKMQKYHTSYFFGGDAAFSNMRVYLDHCGFDVIKTQTDFDSQLPHNKWGIHDHAFLMEWLQDISTLPQPFYTTAMTLSCHEPFDVAFGSNVKANSDPEKFRNAATYVDSALHIFIRGLEQMPNYDQTLIVLIADHGHVLPMNRDTYHAPGYHIPLVLGGGALHPSLRGKRNSTVIAQNDLPALLLQSMGYDFSAYTYCKPLPKDSAKGFAYFALNDGLGWITNDGYVMYRHNYLPEFGGRLLADTVYGESIFNNAKAFQQMLMQDFFNR
ncbi:MAG: hypothetical protein RIQ89_1149 [Bacteroidota bacterium]